MNKEILKIEKLNLNAGNQLLFKDFSLQVFEGQIIGFFAPTGSGKTSLFNYIASLSPVSYAFQDPRLIPSLSVLKNVMLPLENKMNKESAKATATTWLEKLNMSHKINDLAKTLSGGEQQRTAIARAFAFTSGLLLLDEPFASQDESNISNIINLTKQIISTNNRACLVISHDLNILKSFCTKIITQKDFCVEN